MQLALAAHFTQTATLGSGVSPAFKVPIQSCMKWLPGTRRATGIGCPAWSPMSRSRHLR
jgi:hypothetical protein